MFHVFFRCRSPYFVVIQSKWGKRNGKKWANEKWRWAKESAEKDETPKDEEPTKKKWKVLQWIKQYILFCQNKAACKRVYIFNSLSLFGRASSVGFRTGWVCRSSSALRHSSLLPTYAYFLTNLVCVFNSISIFTIHGIFVVVIVVPLFAFRKHVEDVFEFLSLNFDRTSAASMLLFLSGMYLFVLMSSQTRQATSLPHSSYSLLLPCYLVLLSSPPSPPPVARQTSYSLVAVIRGSFIDSKLTVVPFDTLEYLILGFRNAYVCSIAKYLSPARFLENDEFFNWISSIEMRFPKCETIFVSKKFPWIQFQVKHVNIPYFLLRRKT